ncbi:MAG: alkaline phosphatase family protein [Candidatus Heimdallarchaeota archaeon]|nr:alkaline phosphatase family protein [Candidatus Heimdallarchaeota archaeon]MCK5047831.1 alkaline phosphatase family protein [Candidatus Heimdallarchaeota archaeon]
MSYFDRCLYILVDGARPDVIQYLVNQGLLPTIETFFLKEKKVESATTCFPSSTGPAYTPFLTGCYASTANVPGSRWIEKEHFPYDKKLSFKGSRSYVGYEASRIDKDLNPEISTLFEVFEDSYSWASPINRGVPTKRQIGGITDSLFIFAKISHYWEVIDAVGFSKIKKLIKGDWEFAFFVFPAVDELSHNTSPFSKRTLSQYIRLDKYLKHIISDLKKTGKLESTAIIITSDHGLTKTTKHFDLSGFIANIGERVFKYPISFSKKKTCAVLETGNGMAHLYLSDNMDGKWSPNRLADSEMINRAIIPSLLRRQEVDHVLTTNESGEILVRNNKGTGYIRKDGSTIHYEVEGEDPLRYDFSSEKFTDYESLTQTYDGPYPDVLVQYSQIFDSKRTGDIIVTAKLGYDLRKRMEFPLHKATHGNNLRGQILVPLLTNIPISEGKYRTIDVFPTIIDSVDGSRLKGLKYEGRSLVSRK